MKKEFIGELSCVNDQGALELTKKSEIVDNEIITGILTCRTCGKEYKVIRGIPHLINISSEQQANELARFGEQWNWFLKGKFEDPQKSQYGWDRETIISDFFDMTGLTPETLDGKRILDAGSGASKIAYFLTDTFPDKKFEIVSLEVSNAVFSGAGRVCDARAPHLRADIFQPGLQHESFDIVYSVGVLHHTPDPQKAFKSLVPLVKHGGTFATWMYSRRFNPYLDVTGWLWPLVRHFPTPLIYAVAFFLTPFFWLFARITYLVKMIIKPESARWRTIRALPFRGILLRLFDFLQTYYRFRFLPEEITPWYEESGFDNIIVLRPGTNAIRGIRK